MAKVTPIKEEGPGMLSGDAKKQLQSFSERIMRLEDDKAAIVTDLKEVYNEAKDSGLDTKILRKAVRLLRRDPAEAKAEADMVDMYAHAIQPDLFTAAA